MLSIKELLTFGKNQLEKSNIDNASYDARVLLESILQCDRNYLILYGEQKIDSINEMRYRDFIERRSEHYPLQYIIGSQEFMGYEFLVNENVLIPRQDTEILVEKVLEYVDSDTQVLDMCCGSGCIGISIQKESDASVTLADISKEALSVAKRNGVMLDADIEVIESNMYSNIQSTYDIIVSNPPYIRSDVIPTLMEEVKLHEPMLALDGKEDGLYFYRIIIGEARRYLNEKGYLFLEIGCDQAADIRKIFIANQFDDIHIVKDLAGLDRVAYAHI